MVLPVAQVAERAETNAAAERELARAHQRTVVAVPAESVARWAVDRGVAGLAYGCSQDPRLARWTLFEGAAFSVEGCPASIGPGDPDLIAVARGFELTIPFVDRE